MDILDIITGRAGMTFTGRYFEELPGGVEGKTVDGPAYFDYEYVDLTEWRYQKLLGNVITTDSANETVKTRSPLKFRPNAHVALQDGKIYLITSITIDKTQNKQAGAFALAPVGAEKVIRLMEVEDIYGIGGSPDPYGEPQE